ncbi:hypothetical protein M9Y10_025308 [Tritrichomonas musculus]|uniref:Sulfatase N-terminal domain-containing protein n=1 Tax=Tritrichomonas musculus TaxID=1915356 RepID=A0ABR2HCI4_9EUKA
MAVTQTGIPQIYPDPKFKTLAHETDYEYIIGIKGIPDILSTYNYTLNYLIAGRGDVMGFENWILQHHYSRVYVGKNDLYLCNHIAEKYLIEIDKKICDSQFNKKYLTLVVNEDTHSPYRRPRWCKLAFQGMKEYKKCFHCIDYAVGNVINKFLELKMYEHTLLVVFSDHKPFNTNFKQLFILFPGMEKVDPIYRVKGEITYYDFAPTILDLIGIKAYQPECPFGRKVYNDTNESDRRYCFNNKCIQKHIKPNINDMTVMYKFIHFEHGKNIKSNYNLSNPFTCQKNGSKEYYYSDVPCLTNIRGVTSYN